MTLQRQGTDNLANDDVPERFICPLTLEIMEHPYMTRAGHSFERSAIFAWLRRNDNHPLTREPLSPRDLIQNRALKAEIAAWSRKNGMNSDSETELSSSEEEDSCDVLSSLFVPAASFDEFVAQIRNDLADTGAQPVFLINTAALNAGSATPSSVVDETTPRRNRRLRFSLGVRRRR